MKISRHLWLFIILLAAAIVFGSLLGAAHIAWDDDANIFTNPFFRAGMFLQFWTEPYFGLYVPVTSTIWSLLFNLGGGSALPFRLLNLALHLANIVLVYALLDLFRERWRLNLWGVWVAVIVFALHPLQVHAVAWLSGGRDLLAAFFSLLAVLIYFKKGPRHQFALASAFFLLALLCKPVAVILPVVIYLLEWIDQGRPSRKEHLKLAAWLAASLGVTVLTFDAQKAYLNASISFGERTLIALDSYGFYLLKIFWPDRLSANYGRTPLAALEYGDIWLTAGLSLAVMIGFAFLSWRRERHYTLIFVWFASLLPVSGLIGFGYQKISTVSDHYLYFSLFPFTAFLAFLLSRISWAQVPRFAAHGLLVTLLLCYSLTSYTRTRVWTGNEAFFTDMAEVAPNSYATAIGMSVVKCQEQKDYDEGVQWTVKALKSQPLDIVALANQAYCFLHAGNYFRVIELEYYVGQLDLNALEVRQPTAFSSLLASIGTAYIEQNQFNDGFQFLCEAFRIKPAEPGHLRNLEAAAQILRQNGIDPVCEDGSSDEVDPEVDQEREPVEPVWPDAPPEDEPQ